MVGLVFVSHSAWIAEGVLELALAIGGGCPMEAVGGTADGRLGTDATAIAAAIERLLTAVDRPAVAAPGDRSGATPGRPGDPPDRRDAAEHLLILMDIGSSVLAAHTALELIPAELATRVRLSPAPLVEGAVAAAVIAATGASLDEVDAAAREALTVAKL